MQIIVGFGNKLRGEDAFGVDVISKLQKLNLPGVKLISTFQLTPELSLELQEATQIIFIDAAYCEQEKYRLGCIIEERNKTLLSHHISIKTMMAILENLYDITPNFEVFSMLTNNFNEIKNKSEYEKCLNEVVNFIVSTVKQA
ncbi:hydrogenase maturation protease [Halarcobacter ebronensis]|uniref:Hydrogenase maturation protease n=1 Tax=Halarcobacter ebronensis TaxID=1462615 RepID=A0A4Q1AU85_9BACT|nr:hydrogenase maturation protease [Halarcobacter ebronensis]QKF83231.1 bidirectional [Ni-Fe] hydrogenase complex endopeptidase HoxW [Halarcobacter ebronensis]RXK05133.1 hypothetical protein CRV07_08945 [Halarcobacter ebronensis]